VTFGQLQSEFQSELIGVLIYERVSSLTRRYLRRRDPRVYARGAHDYRDGFEDVLNDFVADVLIRERQIDYVMATATDLDSFDALVSRQLRRYLARTRARTEIDNLIDRSVSILSEPPFHADGTGSAQRFSLAKPVAEGRPPTHAEIRLAAALAQHIPRVLGKGEERAPKIYDRDGLGAVLAILLRTAPGSVGKSDLQRFFEDLLTPWAVALLEPTEELEVAGHQLTPAEEAVVEETCQRMVERMTTEDQLIYQYKYANIPDRVVADAIGLSRQSTAPRKKALFEHLAGELRELEPHVQEGVLVRLNGLISSTGMDTS
jgi:hypothetical protein